MKKKDLKNLALRGICGGLLCSAQGLMAQNSDPEVLRTFAAKNQANESTLAGSCGGKSGCGHGTSTLGSQGGSCNTRANQGGSYNTRAGHGSCNSTYPQGSCEGQSGNSYAQGCSSCEGRGQVAIADDANTRGFIDQQRSNLDQQRSNMDQQRRNMDQNDSRLNGQNGNAASQMNRQGQLAVDTAIQPNLDQQRSNMDPQRKNMDQNDSRSNYRNDNAASQMRRQGQLAASDTAMQAKPMTEAELMTRLDSTGKAEYQSLTPEGKALALKIASLDTYKDKNQAVREAIKRIAEKRNEMLKRAGQQR